MSARAKVQIGYTGKRDPGACPRCHFNEWRDEGDGLLRCVECERKGDAVYKVRTDLEAVLVETRAELKLSREALAFFVSCLRVLLPFTDPLARGILNAQRPQEEWVDSESKALADAVQGLTITIGIVCDLNANRNVWIEDIQRVLVERRLPETAVNILMISEEWGGLLKRIFPEGEESPASGFLKGVN